MVNGNWKGPVNANVTKRKPMKRRSNIHFKRHRKTLSKTQSVNAPSVCYQLAHRTWLPQTRLWLRCPKANETNQRNSVRSKRTQRKRSRAYNGHKHLRTTHKWSRFQMAHSFIYNKSASVRSLFSSGAMTGLARQTQLWSWNGTFSAPT